MLCASGFLFIPIFLTGQSGHFLRFHLFLQSLVVLFSGSVLGCLDPLLFLKFGIIHFSLHIFDSVQPLDHRGNVLVFFRHQNLGHRRIFSPLYSLLLGLFNFIQGFKW